MLHYLDDLDSKMESMRAQFEREAELDSPWTSYNPSLGRPLLNTKKFLEKGLAASRAVEPPRTVAVAAPAAGASPAAPVGDLLDDSDVTKVEESTVASPVDALERKFAAHKVTPVGPKTQ